VDGLAVLEEDAGGQALDAVLRSQCGIFVGVD